MANLTEKSDDFGETQKLTPQMYLSLRLLDPLIKFHQISVLASRDLFQMILRQVGEMTQAILKPFRPIRPR